MPTSHKRTPSPALEHGPLPDLVNQVGSGLDYPSLLTARNVCEASRKAVDQVLFEHIAIEECPQGLQGPLVIRSRNLVYPNLSTFLAQPPYDDLNSDTSWLNQMYEFTMILDITDGQPLDPPDPSSESTAAVCTRVNSHLHLVQQSPFHMLRWYASTDILTNQDFSCRPEETHVLFLDYTTHVSIGRLGSLLTKIHCLVLTIDCYEDPTTPLIFGSTGFLDIGADYSPEAITFVFLDKRGQQPPLKSEIKVPESKPQSLHKPVSASTEAPGLGFVHDLFRAVHTLWGLRTIDIVGLEQFLGPQHAARYMKTLCSTAERHALEVKDSSYNVAGREGEITATMRFLTLEEYRKSIGDLVYRLDTIR